MRAGDIERENHRLLQRFVEIDKKAKAWKTGQRYNTRDQRERAKSLGEVNALDNYYRKHADEAARDGWTDPDPALGRRVKRDEERKERERRREL